jgi:hypothetical protein
MEKSVSLPAVAALDAERAGSGLSAVVALFGFTLFVSAFLLFLLEPMIAKMVLPVLGGTPMVWNTCVVFFQTTLVAGYAYAHGAASWLNSRRYAFAYAAVLALPLIVLPVTLRGAASPPTDGHPIVWLLGVLLRSVGLPFFALAINASLLQKLFASTRDRDGRDPYFLYAASNAGSLLALLAYPTLIEPTLSLGAQSMVWAGGYAVLVALALTCMGVATRFHVSTIDPGDTATSPRAHELVSAIGWPRRLKWTGLALLPSSLMLAVTSYLTTDIAAVPLMWVVPLALYLATFVIAFGSRADWWREVADRRLPLPIVALVVFMILHATGPGWIIVPVHLIAFGLAALLCHCELARDRPPASQLTEFYFWISIGGMLGGMFNTLVAPAVFNSILEYPLALMAVSLLRRGPEAARASRSKPIADVVVPLTIAIGTAALISIVHRAGGSPRLALFVPAILVFSQARRARRFALAVIALFLTGMVTANANDDGTVLYRTRTFFGVYRVSVDPQGRYRTLFHGTTLHGMQALDPARATESLTYYHRTGPFGQLFEAIPGLSRTPRVAVVGLGVGTLGTYAQPNQQWTFYEIDPAVETIARTTGGFTFLNQCGDRCRVVVGDARQSLAKDGVPQYGLIVLDAFSSDAIPMHLMTSEALSLYLDRLEPHGFLAFHISNRHLTLGPVLGRLAVSHRLVALERKDNEIGANVRADGKTTSDWVVMARSRDDLAALTKDSRWVPPRVQDSTPVWTDSFSNILSVLTFLN